MKKEVEKQIKGVIRKQRKLAMLATDPVERSQVYGAWAGFLAGMKLTGAISNHEYHQFYDELVGSQNRRLLA